LELRLLFEGKEVELRMCWEIVSTAAATSLGSPRWRWSAISASNAARREPTSIALSSCNRCIKTRSIGTVANVASRLCDEAKPSQILISPRVLMAVEDAVTVEPAGEFALKGIRRPLAAYNVLGTISA
jgi:hypothetical protein